MLRKRSLLRVLMGIVITSGAWGWDALAADAAKAGAEAKPEDVRPDIAKFKGFLVGEIVSVSDTGVVLKVKSVTIVEGSQATNPARLIGREIPVQFATEKGKDGKEQPVKWLVDTVKAAQRMGGLAGLGVFTMPNEMVITNIGGAGKEGGATTTTIVMGGAHVAVAAGAGGVAEPGKAARTGGRITIGGPDGAQIEVPLPGDAGVVRPDEKDKKQAPRILVRVQADEKGTLVMDRAVPGAQPGHEWDSMPKIRLLNVPEVQPPQRPEPKGKGTDF